LSPKTIDENISNCQAGTFVAKNNGEPWHSCWLFFGFVDKFLKKNKPDLVILEQTGSFRGSFVTSQVGNCIGVIFACCGKNKNNVHFLYPTHVKKMVVGKGKCTKPQMRKAVQKWMDDHNVPFEAGSEHATDAIANIICHLEDKKAEKNGPN